jgi:hypothetical protein
MPAGRVARHLLLSTPILWCWREVAASASHAFGNRTVGHVRPPLREPVLGPRERYDPFAAANLAALDGCIRNMARQRSLFYTARCLERSQLMKRIPVVLNRSGVTGTAARTNRRRSTGSALSQRTETAMCVLLVKSIASRR